MPNVQIKDVPEETHRVLRQRAADAHQSLQEYLLGRLIAEASQPTMDEVLTRAAREADSAVSFVGDGGCATGREPGHPRCEIEILRTAR